MKLDNNNHSVFAMYYHLILVVKYRRKVFDGILSDYAKSIFERLAPGYNITLLEWNHDWIMSISCSGHSRRVH